MKHYAADALSHLRIKVEQSAGLNTEVAVLTVFKAFLACVARTEITDFEVIEEPKRPHLFPSLQKSA